MSISRGEAEPAATAAADAAAADQWKTTEMARIKEKYGKQSNKIKSWEDKKSKNAKRKLNRAERAVEKTKMKARRKCSNRIQCIKQIAEGARVQAEERQRNEELKVKERANIMRTTGRVPSSCF